MTAAAMHLKNDEFLFAIKDSRKIALGSSANRQAIIQALVEFDSMATKMLFYGVQVISLMPHNECKKRYIPYAARDSRRQKCRAIDTLHTLENRDFVIVRFGDNFRFHLSNPQFGFNDR